MKKTIKIELPTAAELVAGLDLRHLHEPLTRAELAAGEAERKCTRVRSDLAALERDVATLPARIQAGEVAAGALVEGLRERDAAALLIGPAEIALAKARAGVTAEEGRARQALDAEVARRREVLEKTAAEIAPVLEELRELSLSLSKVLDRDAVGFPAVSWPCDLSCDLRSRAWARSA